MSLPPPARGADALSAEIEATVERCRGAVRGVAMKYGLAEAEIDGVFQEVRIRLWKALKTGERIGSATRSYVYRTASSAALDLIRARRAQRSDDPERPALRLVSASTPETELARTEMSEQIHAAVAALSDSRRPVVRMYLVGYRLPEIAELLGWTEGKTRNLLYRGLDDLRAELRSRDVGTGGTI